MSASSPAVVPGSGWGQGSGVRGQAARSTRRAWAAAFQVPELLFIFLAVSSPQLLRLLIDARWRLYLSIYLPTYLFIGKTLKFIYC